MKITDLTHLIHEDMPVFPGTMQPKLPELCTLEKDGFRELNFTMVTHTGTHIDAPKHMLKNGVSLDQMDIDKFIGKTSILNFSNFNNNIIEINHLEKYREKIQNSEFIILQTNWDKYWGEKKYFSSFPSLSKEAAKWLSKFNLKGIGIDAISIDEINSTNFDVHKILLNNNILIIENLKNLNFVKSEYFTLSILPIKIKNADGSPVRAIAIENL